MKSRRWQRLAVLVGVLALFVLSACTSSAPHHRVGKCTVPCSGTLDGADYVIRMPQHWNGTLLIFSHGYQPPDSAPQPRLSPGDKNGTGFDRVSLDLLGKGFALAGSSWASTGWAVSDGVDAADQLYDQFTQTVSKPNRVYVWGQSLGGLVTELLAERSDWVDGAAPFCGVVGGPLPNFDNWFEALVGAQALLGVHYSLTGSVTTDQIDSEKLAVNAAINAAVRDKSGGGAAKLLYLAALVGLPAKSLYFHNTGRSNDVAAAGQNLAGYLYNGAQFLAEARTRFGGNPAKVFPAADSTALTATQRDEITALHGDPDSFATKVNAAAAPATSSEARRKLVASGNPTGNLRVPTVSLHGTDDPLAIVANETLLHAQVAAEHRTDRLQQLFVEPNTVEPGKGYAHCDFSAAQQVGAIETLDQWVRQGPRPTATTVDENLGAGVDPTYSSPKWPGDASR